MRFRRVVLVLGVLAVAACSSLSRGRNPGAANSAAYAILQGATGPKDAQVAVLHRLDDKIFVELHGTEGAASRQPVKVEEKRSPGSDWMVTQARFSDLDVLASYELRVKNLAGEIRDRRRLRSLATESRKVRVAVVSCMDDSYDKEQGAMWEELLSLEPEVIFFIGDNVYADTVPVRGVRTDPAILWKRYAETRSTLGVFRSPYLIPSFATWDDHDYGVNDGGRNYPHKEDSLRVLNAFFPREPIPKIYERGPGASSRLTAFGQRFILTDGRYFRTEPGEKEVASHWGKEQFRWVGDALKSSAVPAWVIGGDQFFGGYHRFESFEKNHPEEFADFLRLLRNAKGPAVLVSGDRHLTEMMEVSEKDVGYRTYELTSSAIHAKTFPDAWKESPNPRQIAGASGVLNYLVVDVEPGTPLKFTATAYGPGKKVLFTKSVQVAKDSKRPHTAGRR